MATDVALKAPPAPVAVVSHRPLSVELGALQAGLGLQPVRLRTILEALQGRAFELLMIVLVLPFAVPVSVPGMSTPFGIAIAIIAFQLAASRLPWLPQRMLDANIPPGFLSKVLIATKGVVAFLEKFLRPRLPLVTSSRLWVGFHLYGVALAAILLALPLPIPFTNIIPGWAVLLIAMGLLERDGLFIAAGHLVGVFSIVYFVLLGESARQTIEWALRWWHR